MRRAVPTPPSHPLLVDMFMNLTAKDNCTKALSLLVDASKQVRIPRSSTLHMLHAQRIHNKSSPHSPALSLIGLVSQVYHRRIDAEKGRDTPVVPGEGSGKVWELVVAFCQEHGLAISTWYHLLALIITIITFPVRVTRSSVPVCFLLVHSWLR
jgi:hypothetical protein